MEQSKTEKKTFPESRVEFRKATEGVRDYLKKNGGGFMFAGLNQEGFTGEGAFDMTMFAYECSKAEMLMSVIGALNMDIIEILHILTHIKTIRSHEHNHEQKQP